MSTNFERQKAQLRCESFLNCQTLVQWNQADFRSLQLNRAQAYLLSSDLREDSKDLYFKGLLSLFEALNSISKNLFSWATIKLYYAVYYFLKSSLAANGIALIRNKSLFYLKAIDGEMPIAKGNKKYNSDHSGTINFFIDLLSGSDILLSQDIESSNVYEWIMHRREQVNYRERTFKEPSHSEFWNYISAQTKAGKLETLVTNYIQDNFVLCFQEEHAILAIPLKRVFLTKQKLDGEGINIEFTKAQRELLIKILPVKMALLIQLTDSIPPP
jgi:hypothetical protein